MASTRISYLAIKAEATANVAEKPTHFIRYKEGGIALKQEIIANNPIQKIRWNPITAVPGKISAESDFMVDLDVNECVYWLWGTFGTLVSADISSLTDGSVYRHTLTTANSLPTFSIEQGKGNIDDTTNNRQNYQVDRAFGCQIDTLSISGSDGLISVNAKMKAAGVFEMSDLITNESVETASKAISGVVWAVGIATFTSAVHGYAVGDLVTVAGMTPSGYNGQYKILTVPLTTTFTVAITNNPGAFSAGGTATKNAMFGFRSTDGLAATDVVDLYEATTPANETATILYNDTVLDKLGFVLITATTFTVANISKVELTPQTPTYSLTPRIFSFVHCKFKLGADLTAAALAADENVENWEFTYENQIEERYGSLRASPSVIAPKGAMAKMKYTKYFENVTDRDRYLRQTRRAMILTITNGDVISATDTLLATYKVKIEMSDIRFTSYDMPTGTDELYAIECEATCFYDATDGRACRAIVENSRIGTTYTA